MGERSSSLDARDLLKSEVADVGKRRIHGASLPNELSRLPVKRDLYAVDTYFLESWEDFLAVVGEQAIPPPSRFASLTLKPDAVVGRTLKPTLEWLGEHGFSIVAAELVELERHIIRSIWLYSWNVASRDRKDLVNILLTATPSLFLALLGPEDASLWLSQNKGPANPEYRRPSQLRSRLGYFSTLLNFVHTSDEPADFIRELAVYFPADTRQRIYRAMGSPADSLQRAEDLTCELEARHPAHDLDLDHSIDRVRAAVGSRKGDAAGVELHHLLDAIAGRRTRDWRTLFRLAKAAGVSSLSWDLIVIATNLVQMDNPDIDPILPGVSSMDLTVVAVP